ncbi:MAG: MBL fold metallo-hydrolase [Planctomycetota bacterium]|jgi:glyoxylase-like metal-dependent hydrolase (beta-lactamase superfamily II)
MIPRTEIFPNVIEMNYQARKRLGCCVYLVYDGPDWLLIDIGYSDTVAEIVDLIRQMDFSLSDCRYLIATHADVDHIQGLKLSKEMLPSAETIGHPETAQLLLEGNRVATYAEIAAQKISLDLPTIKLDRTINDGDIIPLGNRQLEVWHTPGHTHGMLSFRMHNLLFCADNIYRDGCVGNIDAHHGSDIPDFMESLTRIRNSDVEWLLPSHGPPFRKDDALLDQAIARLERYSHRADFGTCAVDWPLLDEWEDELERGVLPK